MAFAYLRTLVASLLSPAKEIQATEAATGEGLKEALRLQSDLEIAMLSVSGDFSINKPDPAVYEYCCRRYAVADAVYIDGGQVERSDRRMRHRSRRIKSKERDLEIDAARRAKRQIHFTD